MIQELEVHKATVCGVKANYTIVESIKGTQVILIRQKGKTFYLRIYLN